jgi:hypothetical protein
MTPSSAVLSPPNGCHPERSVAESEANRQTQSKDPYRAEAAGCKAGNFRIIIRFFDEQETEHRPLPSCEAAAWESPSRKCRVTTQNTNQCCREVTLTTKRQ